MDAQILMFLSNKMYVRQFSNSADTNLHMGIYLSLHHILFPKNWWNVIEDLKHVIIQYIIYNISIYEIYETCHTFVT